MFKDLDLQSFPFKNEIAHKCIEIRSLRMSLHSHSSMGHFFYIATHIIFIWIMWPRQGMDAHLSTKVTNPTKTKFISDRLTTGYKWRMISCKNSVCLMNKSQKKNRFTSKKVPKSMAKQQTAQSLQFAS